MEINFNRDAICDYLVATKFYTRHDSAAFLPWAMLCICLSQFGLKQKTQNTLNDNPGGQIFLWKGTHGPIT